MWNKFNNSNSNWWSGGNLFDSEVDILTGEKVENKSAELLKLAGYRRAIANFVSIVTGDSIPVKFNSKDQSYTDGKTVVVSGKIKDKDFDSTVGLALHEGSHIKLTDFDVLPKLYSHVPQEVKQMIKNKFPDTEDWAVCNYIESKLKMLLNVVEDRRIDNYIFKSAPGYKGYYNALYDRYFHSKSIDKGLQSGDYRELDWESYMFRIINITNANRDLNALPGLKDIWNAMDLKNISRLSDTMQALRVALDIFEIVEDYIPSPKSESKQPKQGGNSNGEDEEEETNGSCGGGNNMTNEGEGGECKTPDGGDADDDGSTADGDDANLGQGNLNAPEVTNQAPEKLSHRQKQMLDKAIKKQEEFLDGDIPKSKLTNSDKSKMEKLEKSGAELKQAGEGVQNYGYWGTKQKATNVLVIKNCGKDLIEDGCFGFTNYPSCDYYYKKGEPVPSYMLEDSEEAVNKGIVLGKLLGKKLQVRSDVKTTKFTRLDSGKMDKRLIASLGYGAERIFSQTLVDQYNPAYLHISIDASGSMHGKKWDESITAAVAIAQAASMTQNVHVAISLRGSDDGTPIVVVAYDSKVDKMTKIKTYFKYFKTRGLTPEGLCFEAIQDLIIAGSNNIDSYFLNFSDGAPYWTGGVAKNKFYYAGKPANKHTAHQCKKMRENGIKIISYFIEDGRTEPNQCFKECYGKDAKCIDTNNVKSLAKTMNDKFLQK